MSMAVGIIVGSAFTAIVTSLNQDIITPLLGLILGQINFAGLSFTVGNATVTYGNFIQAIIKNGQLGSAVQEVGRSKGLLAGMRAVKFTADGEVVDLSAFLGEAAEDEESESVEAASAAAAVADELSAKDDAKDAE